MDPRRQGRPRLIPPKRTYMLMNTSTGNAISNYDDKSEALEQLLVCIDDLHREGGDITDAGLLELDGQGQATRRLWPWPMILRDA